MTTYLIYSATTDTALASGSATYSTARSGGTLSLLNAGATYTPGGQAYNTSFGGTWTPALTVGAIYYCYESFFAFDTTAVTTAGQTISSAALFMSVGVGSLTGFTFRSFDWGTAVTTADWVPGATLATLPVAATLPTGSGNMTTSFDPARVVAGGTTRVVATSGSMAAGTVPTGSEIGQLAAAEAGNKPYLRVTTAPLHTLAGVQHASAQMPGLVKAGEPAVISVRSTGTTSPTLTLGWTALNSTTFNTIDTLPSDAFDIVGGKSEQNIAVTVAPNGDIFVVGSRFGVAWAIAVKAYVKTGTSTWSPRVSLYQAISGATGLEDWTRFAITYVRHATTDCIFVVASSPSDDSPLGWATLNVASARAGSGSAFIASGINPTWHSMAYAYTEQRPFGLSVSSRGLDGKVFVQTAAASNVLTISAGTITASGYTALAYFRQPKTQALSLGADSFLEMYRSGSWHLYMDKRTAAADPEVGNAIGYDAFPGNDPAEVWDAVWDERAGLVRIYMTPTTTRTIHRYDLNPVTNVLSSTPVVISSTVGSVGSVINAVRTVDNTLDERVVMIECAVNTAGVLSTVVLLDTVGNVAPNAPILTVKNNFVFSDPATFSWTYSDPNSQDSQSKYDLQIQRVSDSVDVVNVVGTVSSVGSHVLAGSTLANNTSYRWRVRTYDQLATQGAWSAYSTFATSDAPIIIITDPATDNLPTDQSSISILWTFATVSGATQAQRRVRLIRTSDSAVISDTGMQPATLQTQTVSGMASDVEYRIEVTGISTAGITSGTATRLVTPSYSSALAPSFTVTPVGEYLLLQVSNPESGSRPLVLSNEVWKRETGVGAYQRVATGVANDGTYRDYAVAQGKMYDYFVRAVF